MGNHSNTVKGAALFTTALALPALFACLDHPLKPVDYSSYAEGDEGVQLALNKDVDILFVIDNSGSMSEEQANLARQFGRFIARLEDVEANYRIGVTTTDNGNPYCAARASNYSPEGGQLQLHNCSERPAEFEYNGTNYHDQGCLAQCSQDDIPIVPTTTHVHDEPSERIWLESIGSTANISDDITMSEAFACFGPQGVAGCGFESPLEAMRRAIARFAAQVQPEYGFMRPQALLAIVFVTDEADCSYNPAQSAVWTEYNAYYWPDNGVSTPVPRSSTCWKAGVECSGDNGHYEECHPVDRDSLGNIITDPTRADEEAVLVPLQRYIDELEAVEAHKRKLTGDPDHEVIVAGITGVPVGYADGEAEIGYRDSSDTSEQTDYGIAPGCSDPSTGVGYPPVRLRAFAEAFAAPDERNLYSVCNDDYGPALEAIARKIGQELPPACMPRCVADIDAVAPGLQPSCVVEETRRRADGGTQELEVPECESGRMLPEGADACWVALTDRDGSTADPNDDMDPYCVEHGHNLEFDLVRRDGIEPPAGTSVSATCQLELDCDDACPGLASCG